MKTLSADEIEGMRAAGRVAAATLRRAVQAVQVGVTTAELDALVARDTLARGATAAQLGYEGPDCPFPGHVCTSVNEVVCHGIPGPRRLVDGDIINIDVTSEFGGWHGDTNKTVAVGKVPPRIAHLMQVADRALQVGIDAVKPGLSLAVVGHAIEAYVESMGCSVVRDYGGHGIGRSMHCAPHVSHHRTPLWSAPLMRVGMCFTIEPMICLGRANVRLLDDGWTVVTEDGSWCAAAEHTLVVQPDGAEVLTR